jgi:hypothetical protein
MFCSLSKSIPVPGFGAATTWTPKARWGPRLSRSTEFRLNSEAKIYLFISCLQQQNKAGTDSVNAARNELALSLRHLGETLDPQTATLRDAIPEQSRFQIVDSENRTRVR